MKQEINRFTAYTNCPPGEYDAILNKSDIKKYPKGEKAPVNLLKLGVSMVQIGEKDQGCKMITGLKKEYPKASKSVLQKAQYEQKRFKCNS